MNTGYFLFLDFEIFIGNPAIKEIQVIDPQGLDCGCFDTLDDAKEYIRAECEIGDYRG